MDNMLRVLLVIEDYSESVFLQILLKKLGFEVEALKNPKLLNESLGRLFPDLVVMTAKGKRVSGLEMASGLKKGKRAPKILLTAAPQASSAMTDEERNRVDAVIATPVSPADFLEGIGRLCDLDAQALIEKYKKMKHQIQIEDAETKVERDGLESGELMHIRSEREERYQKFLTLDKPPEQAAFSKARVVREVKEIRAQSNDPKLEEERQAFLKALFEKKS